MSVQQHYYPHSKVHGANMGPTWVLSAPDGPHFDPLNLAVRVRMWCRNDSQCDYLHAKHPWFQLLHSIVWDTITYLAPHWYVETNGRVKYSASLRMCWGSNSSCRNQKQLQASMCMYSALLFPSAYVMLNLLHQKWFMIDIRLTVKHLI